MCTAIYRVRDAVDRELRTQKMRFRKAHRVAKAHITENYLWQINSTLVNFVDLRIKTFHFFAIT